MHYDELLFVDAARSNNPTLFIYKSLFGIPILLMNYIGALKSWIYMPIFALFEVDVYSIRLPMVLLGIGTLAIYYKILSQFLSRTLLILGFFLICSDPGFAIVNRIDWGPNAIAHFLIALFMWQFLIYLKTASPYKLVILILIAVIGIFDKLNFIWFTSGITLSAIIFYHNDIFAVLKSNIKANATILSLAALMFVLMAVFWVLPSLKSIESDKSYNLLAKLAAIYKLMPSIFNSQSIYSMIFNIEYPYQINLFIPVSIIVLILSLFVRKNESIKLGHFCLLVVVSITIQIWLIRSAGGPHHYLLFWPFHWLFLIFCSKGIIQRFPKFNLILKTALALLLVLNFWNDYHFIKQLNKSDSWKPVWNPAIYKLIDYLEARPTEEIFCLDWGIGTQIKATAKLPINSQVHDVWPSFWDDPKISTAKNLKKRIRDNASDLTKVTLIEFLPYQAVRPAVHLNLIKLVSALPKYQIQTKVIHSNGYGYFVHNFRRKS